MKKTIQFISLAVITVFFAACEKVIDLPLNEAEQEIVVEATLKNFEGESFIKLSKTGTVYDDGGFEKLSGAVVTVTDKDGIVTIFTEDATTAGTYLAPDFITTPNNTYSLNVNYQDEVITAQSQTQTTPKLDSLTFITQIGGFGPNANDTSALVFYNFVDNGDEENYYRFRVWVNGELDDNFYIGDDGLGNGQYISAPFFATSIQPRDTVYVELQSIDKANYTYLVTLASNVQQGPFSATPANPVSNIENAIGVFNTTLVDSLTLILP